MEIISRNDWGARAPADTPTQVQPSERDTFMVHYSTGQELGREDTHDWVRDIQDFHMDGQNWNDIGYNFLIDKEGRIFEGRGWNAQGAHCTGWNTRAIGVCYLGNDDPDSTDLTDAAKKSYVWLYSEASKLCGRALARKGHRDGKATTCPGDEIYEWVHLGMPLPASEVSTDPDSDVELVLDVPEGWTVKTENGKIVFTQEAEVQVPNLPEQEPEPTPEPDPEPVPDAPVTDDDGVPPLPRPGAFVPGTRHTSFTAMGHEMVRWLGKNISHDGNGYQPGPVYSKYDDVNVRKIQSLMGDTPDPVGKEYFGAKQWNRLFTGAPAKTPAPAPEPAPEPTTSCATVPARRFFAVGQSHKCFTVMGRRFLVWLGNDISKAGGTYTPGPRFSAYDVENVKKVQRLMGDKADGWFGQEQWTRLMKHAPPRTAEPSGADVPVDGMRITQHFGRDSSGYAAGEHTGVDFGDSGSDAIRCTAAGTVVYRGYSGAWGNRVIVRHANGRYSWYCHLASFRVSNGQRVSRGTVIGNMGNTGNSTGKHLHYQESVGGYGYWDYKRPVLIRAAGY